MLACNRSVRRSSRVVEGDSWEAGNSLLHVAARSGQLEVMGSRKLFTLHHQVVRFLLSQKQARESKQHHDASIVEPRTILQLPL